MIARKTWRELRWLIVGYTLMLEVLLVPAIMLWPRLRDEQALAPMLGRLIPIQSFKHMFEAIGSSDSDTAFRAYMAVQMFFKGVNVVGICGAVLLTTGLVARERENLTLEFLLARPVGRSRVLLAKFTVVVLALAIPIFATSWSAIPLSWLVDETLPFGAVTLAAAHATAFVLVFAALTCVASTLTRTQVHAAFLAGMIIVVQLAVYFIQDIRVGSVFMLSDFDVYGPILAGNRSAGQVLLGDAAWLIASAAALYLTADRLFRRCRL